MSPIVTENLIRAVDGVPFQKVTGGGNDFVLIDNRNGRLAGDSSSLVKRVCHRGLGVGADGFILVESRRSRISRWSISIATVARPTSAATGCAASRAGRRGQGRFRARCGWRRAGVLAADGVAEPPWFALPLDRSLISPMSSTVGPRKVEAIRMRVGVPHIAIAVPDAFAPDVLDDAPALRLASRFGRGKQRRLLHAERGPRRCALLRARRRGRDPEQRQRQRRRRGGGDALPRAQVTRDLPQQGGTRESRHAGRDGIGPGSDARRRGEDALPGPAGPRSSTSRSRRPRCTGCCPRASSSCAACSAPTTSASRSATTRATSARRACACSVSTPSRTGSSSTAGASASASTRSGSTWTAFARSSPIRRRRGSWPTSSISTRAAGSSSGSSGSTTRRASRRSSTRSSASSSRIRSARGRPR